MPATTYMPVYVSNLIASTVDMTPSQFGCYMRLLCYAWEQGGIPNDFDSCCRIAGGMDAKDWNVIRRRFEVIVSLDGDAKLSHPRLEAERAKCQQKYDSKCAAAAKARASRSVSNPVSNVDDNLVSNVDNNPVSNPVIRLQPEPEPELEPTKNDSSSSSTQKNLRATPQKRRRSYRIGWSLEGGFTGISDEDRTVWASAYPGVNLVAELAKAHVYLRENPAKTGKRNWGAFLARWFARVQDRGGSASQAKPAPERWADKFQEAPYRTPKELARLRASAGPQKPVQRAGGVTTLSDVIGRLSESQEAQNGNHPN